MELPLSKGVYILAVSGGVDSMVLLDQLRNKPGVELIVAHFNHGIRHDAIKDEKLVVRAASKHGLKIEVGYGRLGVGASEARARNARYNFLESIRKKHTALSIITAHHQDDLLETALINVLRGTGKSGLISMLQNKKIIRPMIKTSKTSILNYAKINHIDWLEDTTNQQDDYLRNYIRHHVLAGITKGERNKLLSNIENIANNKTETDRLIATISQIIMKNSKIERKLFVSLPAQIADELVVFWLRNLSPGNFSRSTIDRISTAIKTAPADTTHEIYRGYRLRVGRLTAQFTNRVDDRLL